jgi:hypothetical protein
LAVILDLKTDQIPQAKRNDGYRSRNPFLAHRSRRRRKVMEFQKYEFTAKAGAVVVIHLDRAANVRLMETPDFRRFREGKDHHYYGGVARRSPLRLAVPRTGRWFVTIDLGSRGGSVRSSITVV